MYHLHPYTLMLFVLLELFPMNYQHCLCEVWSAGKTTTIYSHWNIAAEGNNETYMEKPDSKITVRQWFQQSDRQWFHQTDSGSITQTVPVRQTVVPSVRQTVVPSVRQTVAPSVRQTVVTSDRQWFHQVRQTVVPSVR